GGLLDIRTQALDQQEKSIQDQIDVRQRQVDKVAADLRAQFTALETFVNDLKTQGSFLSSAFSNYRRWEEDWMQSQQYPKRYTQAQVTSVDRKQLLLLVLDGGLTFLRRARAALAAGNLNEYAENLRRAQAIISELLSTLDHEAGGQIATDLARLYEFMLFH